MSSNAIRKIALESVDIIWFVARASTLKGPFTTEQLQQQLKSREISYLDFCWRQGFKEWRPLGSVEDFDQRSRLRTLPSYPSVEVPCGPSGGLGSIDSAAPPNTTTYSTKKVQVSFARSRRYSISIYEWGLAIIFSVALSYLSAVFALREVQKNVLTGLGLMSLGIAQNLGEAPHPVDPHFWEPLYSAPNYVELVNDSQLLKDAGLIPYGLESARPSLPVLLTGTVSIVANPADLHLADHIVNNSNRLPLSGTVPHVERADPIYVRPLILRGFLDPLHPEAVDVHLPGDPSIF